MNNYYYIKNKKMKKDIQKLIIECKELEKEIIEKQKNTNNNNTDLFKLGESLLEKTKQLAKLVGNSNVLKMTTKEDRLNTIKQQIKEN